MLRNACLRALHEIRDIILALNRRLIYEPWSKTAAASTPNREGGDGRLKRTGLTSWILTVVSLICLVFIIILTISYRPVGAFHSSQFVTLLFITICCLGATAALLPSKCSRIFHHIQVGLPQGDNGSESDQKRVFWSGHHPTCGCYATHVLHIRGKTYCAGCIGLLTGALLAIVGSVAYSLQIISVVEEATPLFWVGSFSVSLGLLQYARPLMMNGWIHYLLNTIFVSGAFLLLVGVIEINGTLFVETYFLAMLLFWILARVALSNVEHQRICQQCESTSCMCRMK
jgi:hypothetical protein